MKKSFKIIILALFFLNLIFSQSKLTITTWFCNTDTIASKYDHSTELYKDGIFITEKFYPINDYTVKKLKKGKYLLKYKSIFNQEYELEFKLNKKKNEIRICIDEFSPINGTSLFDNFNKNDTLEFWMYSEGCEYEDIGKITLTKNENFIHASYIRKNTVWEKIINAQDIRLLKEIEQKIMLIKEIEGLGYTITYNYKIILNGKEKVGTFYGIEPTQYVSIMNKIFKK